MASFHTNIRALLAGQGILRGGLSTASAFSIYSGTQPTAADILAAWPSYNSTNASFLAHYSGAVWSQPTPNSSPVITISTLPTVITTVNTGTGAWCILWSANHLVAAMGNATIPTTSFIVAPVSVLPGNGTIRFTGTADFVAGVSRQITDGVFTPGST